jgi:hypothetical protein
LAKNSRFRIIKIRYISNLKYTLYLILILPAYSLLLLGSILLKYQLFETSYLYKYFIYSYLN